MACWTLAVTAMSHAASDPPAGDADLLYANRETLADAEQAAAIWDRALTARPDDFEAARKLARASYWLGEHRQGDQAREAAFNRGMAAAERAIAAQSNHPDGYFWLAANMGGLAELKGIRAGLKYRRPVRDNLEKVLAMDPTFLKGSADRALGRWYYKVPGLFGGSKTKSVQHLRASLGHHPQSIASRFFLAETLESIDRRAEAITVLNEIETLAVDPDWAPEDREFKAKARTMLRELRQ